MQDIERLTGTIQGKHVELEASEASCLALRTRRAALQPEVSKLLQCHAALEAQQRCHARELQALLSPLRHARSVLSVDVRRRALMCVCMRVITLEG